MKKKTKQPISQERIEKMPLLSEEADNLWDLSAPNYETSEKYRESPRASMLRHNIMLNAKSGTVKDIEYRQLNTGGALERESPDSPLSTSSESISSDSSIASPSTSSENISSDASSTYSSTSSESVDSDPPRIYSSKTSTIRKGAKILRSKISALIKKGRKNLPRPESDPMLSQISQNAENLGYVSGNQVPDYEEIGEQVSDFPAEHDYAVIEEKHSPFSASTSGHSNSEFAEQSTYQNAPQKPPRGTSSDTQKGAQSNIYDVVRGPTSALEPTHSSTGESLLINKGPVAAPRTAPITPKGGNNTEMVAARSEYNASSLTSGNTTPQLETPKRTVVTGSMHPAREVNTNPVATPQHAGARLAANTRLSSTNPFSTELSSTNPFSSELSSTNPFSAELSSTNPFSPGYIPSTSDTVYTKTQHTPGAASTVAEERAIGAQKPPIASKPATAQKPPIAPKPTVAPKPLATQPRKVAESVGEKIATTPGSASRTPEYVKNAPLSVAQRKAMLAESSTAFDPSSRKVKRSSQAEGTMQEISSVRKNLEQPQEAKARKEFASKLNAVLSNRSAATGKHAETSKPVAKASNPISTSGSAELPKKIPADLAAALKSRIAASSGPTMHKEQAHSSAAGGRTKIAASDTSPSHATASAKKSSAVPAPLPHVEAISREMQAAFAEGRVAPSRIRRSAATVSGQRTPEKTVASVEGRAAPSQIRRSAATAGEQQTPERTMASTGSAAAFRGSPTFARISATLNAGFAQKFQVQPQPEQHGDIASEAGPSTISEIRNREAATRSGGMYAQPAAKEGGKVGPTEDQAPTKQGGHVSSLIREFEASRSQAKGARH